MGDQGPPDQFSNFVEPNTPEFEEFCAMLKANFEGANSKNLCVWCWCLCNRYQMNRHKEMGHQIQTPRLFKDGQSFIELATQCKKYRDIYEEGQFVGRVYLKIQKHTDFLTVTNGLFSQEGGR